MAKTVQKPANFKDYGTFKMNKKSRGFTLLEVIAVLVVGGIVAALLVPFMGSALTESQKPLENLKRSTGLSSDMARLIGAWDDVFDDCLNNNNSLDLDCVENELKNNLEDPDRIDLEAVFVEFLADNDNGNEEYVEQECSDDCDLVKVVIKGSDSPGEKLMYYFNVEQDI